MSRRLRASSWLTRAQLRDVARELGVDPLSLEDRDSTGPAGGAYVATLLDRWRASGEERRIRAAIRRALDVEVPA